MISAFCALCDIDRVLFRVTNPMSKNWEVLAGRNKTGLYNK